MMQDFLASHRDELIASCKAKVSSRPERHASEEQLKNGIPLFLEQLRQTLIAESAHEAEESLRISGPPGGSLPGTTEIGVSATAHGKTLLELGYTVDQVVHDYGDLCQSITEIAFEKDLPFSIGEFKSLNRCLDNAIADAVTEFSLQRDADRAALAAAEVNERLGFLLHELRNAMNSGSLALQALQQANLPVAGATGAVLKRSFSSMKSLIDGSLAEVRTASKTPVPRTVFSLAAFIREVRAEAQLEALAKGCSLFVDTVDPILQVEANRELLHGALTNLLSNAFKFTHRHTAVHLTAREVAGRVHIDVADHCGGLPDEYRETLFKSFSQLGDDKTGLGLGLPIARQNVAAMGGTLTVENLPGVGCIFTIGLEMKIVDRRASERT